MKICPPNVLAPPQSPPPRKKKALTLGTAPNDFIDLSPQAKIVFGNIGKNTESNGPPIKILPSPQCFGSLPLPSHMVGIERKAGRGNWEKGFKCLFYEKIFLALKLNENCFYVFHFRQKCGLWCCCSWLWRIRSSVFWLCHRLQWRQNGEKDCLGGRKM